MLPLKFFVASLIYPGEVIINKNAQWSNKMFFYVRILESVLNDLAITLSYYESVTTIPLPRFVKEPDFMEFWSNRSQQIIEEVEHNNKEEKSSTNNTDTEIKFEIECRIHEEQWNSGRMPADYEARLKSIFAQMFVYNLDKFNKILFALQRELTKPSVEKDIHKVVSDARKVMTDKFPDLRGVRDSNAHYDERLQRQAKSGKPIIGPLIMDTFVGNNFCFTMHDSKTGSVEINERSLLIVRELIQNVINAFEWTGQKRHRPE